MIPFNFALLYFVFDWLSGLKTSGQLLRDEQHGSLLSDGYRSRERQKPLILIEIETLLRFKHNPEIIKYDITVFLMKRELLYEFDKNMVVTCDFCSVSQFIFATCNPICR